MLYTSALVLLLDVPFRSKAFIEFTTWSDIKRSAGKKKPASRSALDKEAQFQVYHMEPLHFCASICLMMCRFVKKIRPWHEDLHIPFSAVAKPCVQQFNFQPHQDITTWEMKAPRGRVYCNSEWLQCWDRWTWQEMCLNFKLPDSWL